MQKAWMQRKAAAPTRLHWLLIIIVLGCFTAEARAGEATDQLRATVERLIGVLNDPAMKGPANTERRRTTLHQLFAESFDQTELARKALGRYWDDRSAAEQEAFTQVFSNLLEKTYFDKIDAYLTETPGFSADNIQYLKETPRKHYAVVETSVNTGGQTTIPVFYQMKIRDKRWQICDIAIEGVSLLKNYRVQFSEIMSTGSFDELMKRLKSKEGSQLVKPALPVSTVVK